MYFFCKVLILNLY